MHLQCAFWKKDTKLLKASASIKYSALLVLSALRIWGLMLFSDLSCYSFVIELDQKSKRPTQHNSRWPPIFKNSCSSNDVCFQNLIFYRAKFKKDASPTAAAANKVAIYWSLWCSKVKHVEWILKPTFFSVLFHFLIIIYVTALNWIP